MTPASQTARGSALLVIFAGAFLVSNLNAQVARFTSLSVSPQGSAQFGEPVTLTATVSPSTATGTVEFFDGVVVVGAAVLNGSVAKLVTPILGAGPHALRAFYPGQGAVWQASKSAAVQLTVNAVASSGFSAGPVPYYATDRNPFALDVGDFNGDGILDLAVANNYGDDVSVLLGNGDGSFQAPVNYPAGTYPGAVTVCDVNGDGNLWLLTEALRTI